MKWYARRELLIFLLLLCLFLLLLPILSRGNRLIGGEGYYNLRLAEEKNFNYDKYSFSGRYFYGEIGYIYLLSFAPDFFSKLLPFFFGIGSFILFYFIVEMLKRDLRNIAGLFLLLNPGFLWLFTHSSKYSAGVFFFLLGIYFMMRMKLFYCWIIVLLIGFFSFWLGLIYFLSVLFFIKPKKIFYLSGLFLLFFGFFEYRFIAYEDIFNLGLYIFSFSNVANNFLIEFGGIYLSLFSLILVFIGMTVLWKQRFIYILAYVSLFIFFLFGFYFEFFYYILIFLLVYLSAIGLDWIISFNWSDKILGGVILFLFLLTSVFGAYFTENDLIYSEPSIEFIDSLNFLNNWSSEDVVFSHYTNGHYISYIRMKNLMDEHFSFSVDLDERLIDSSLLYESVYIRDAKDILDKYNVRFILIDQNMRRLWIRDDEELLFLLKYSDEFTLVFENDEVKIYEYNGRLFK